MNKYQFKLCTFVKHCFLGWAMTDIKLPNNATDSIKGVIYQFYIALDYCFALRKGEKIYVERFGDITVSSDSQIEIKNYNSPLTDTHENLWKTLKNWLDEDFDPSSYNHLVLLTTQYLGSKSTLFGWNNLDPNQKLEKLQAIQNSYQNRTKKDQITDELISTVLSTDNRSRLNNVLSKFTITTDHPNGEEFYENLKEIHGKGVLAENRGRYIDSLMGFIINPKMADQTGWEISYDEFTAQVRAYTDLYRAKTIIFPSHTKPNVDSTQYDTYLFVRKINAIELFDEIPYAITDYVRTQETIVRELKNHAVPESSYKAYEENLLEIHNQEYRKAKRQCADDVIGNSQSFYDTMMNKEVQQFHSFNNTPLYFRNGVIHSIADDDTRDLKWKLSDE